jgi:hypothetical protein
MSVLRPATLDEYLTWLRAWLDAGNQPTHAYDYPWSRRTWLTATRDFRLGGECGVYAVNILVPPGIQRVGGELGHNELYFMDGPEQRGRMVPVFSDPVFELLPGVREFVAGERLKEAAWHRERAEAEEQRQRMAADSDVPRSAR